MSKQARKKDLKKDKSGILQKGTSWGKRRKKNPPKFKQQGALREKETHEGALRSNRRGFPNSRRSPSPPWSRWSRSVHWLFGVPFPPSQWPLDHLQGKTGPQAHFILGKVQSGIRGCVGQRVEKASDPESRLKMNEFHD